MKVNIKIKRDDDIKFRILRWIRSSKYQRWLLRTRRKKKRKEEAEKGWGTGAGIQSWRRSTAPASTRASQVAGQRHPPRPAPHARPTLTCPANVGQRRPSPTRSAHRQWMAFRRDWRASDPRGNGSFFFLMAKEKQTKELKRRWWKRSGVHALTQLCLQITEQQRTSQAPIYTAYI